MNWGVFVPVSLVIVRCEGGSLGAFDIASCRDPETGLWTFQWVWSSLK